MGEYTTLDYQVRTRMDEHSPLVLLADTKELDQAQKWANGQWKGGKFEVVILKIEKSIVARKVKSSGRE